MYALRLRLMEKDAPLLDMTLTLPSRDLADRFSRRWPTAAPAFYGFLMKELGDDFSPDAQPPSMPAQDAFLDSGEHGQGCLLHLHRGEPSVPALSLTLALPTESMALFFAGRWATIAQAIYAFLMARLAED